MAKTRTEIQAKYDAENRKTYSLKLNVKYDADIIEKLDNIESKNGYIRDLIRQDIARTGSVPGSSVPVSMCEAARQMLQETADKKNMDVCDLAKLIISEWLVRNGIRT